MTNKQVIEVLHDTIATLESELEAERAKTKRLAQCLEIAIDEIVLAANGDFDQASAGNTLERLAALQSPVPNAEADELDQQIFAHVDAARLDERRKVAEEIAAAIEVHAGILEKEAITFAHFMSFDAAGEKKQLASLLYWHSSAIRAKYLQGEPVPEVKP